MKKKENTNRLFLLLLLFSLTLTSVFAGCKKKDMTPKLNNPHNIHGVANFSRTFGDRNQKQMEIAQAIGISPIASRQEAEKMALIPGAARLLDTIGQNFLDSLAAKGLNPNKIIVTSVLRTENDVKRLRRHNYNAVPLSTHSYGTTFDISWKRFDKVEDPDGRPMEDVRPDTLKLVLAEVLRDLRQAEKCYVKYEIRQACFHITTRQN